MKRKKKERKGKERKKEVQPTRWLKFNFMNLIVSLRTLLTTLPPGDKLQSRFITEHSLVAGSIRAFRCY